MQQQPKHHASFVHAAILLLAVAACGDDDKSPTVGATSPSTGATDAPAPPTSSAPTPAAKHTYVTSTVLLGDDQTTYVALLDSLDTQTVTLDQAAEFTGWASVYPHEGNLFVTDGDAPTLTRFTVGEDRKLSPAGSMSFMNFGARYAESTFIAPDKAYVITDDLIAWTPSTMSVTGTTPVPVLPDRAAGLAWSGAAPGRAVAVRGNRTFIATSWSNWDSFDVSEDSVILVVDNDTNAVVQQLAVPCPYVDVASVADDGYVYFSNWVYSMPQTLLAGKKKACAVRIPPNSDTLDSSWSVTFADATQGREAAALHYIGENKAVISVFHQERVDLAAVEDRAKLANEANWRFWVLDLVTRTAAPLEGIDFNAGGAYAARVDGRSFLLVPGSDYKDTSVYEVSPKGTATLRWKTPGWSTFIGKLR